MKRIAFMLVPGLALAVASAFSQTQTGSWECSLTGNAGSVSQTRESSGGGYSSSSDGEAQGYLALDFRVGRYVAPGLSIEPEFYFLAIEKEPPAFNLGANLAYTFTIPESRVKPFIIAGYGIGNGIPVMQRLLGQSSGKLDIPVLRVGTGLKIFISDQVAFKVEYRYERYSSERTDTYYYPPYPTTYTYKTTSNYHNVLFGFSVFLPAAE